MSKQNAQKDANANVDEQGLADGLKALAHPSRLNIIKQLVERDRCCGGDFCACLDLSQSTISQHLEQLKQAGIVEWQQQGTRSIYTLNRERLLYLSSELKALARESLNLTAVPANTPNPNQAETSE